MLLIGVLAGELGRDPRPFEAEGVSPIGAEASVQSKLVVLHQEWNGHHAADLAGGRIDLLDVDHCVVRPGTKVSLDSAFIFVDDVVVVDDGGWGTADRNITWNRCR